MKRLFRILALFIMISIGITMTSAQEPVLLPSLDTDTEGEFTVSTLRGTMLNRYDGTHVLIFENAPEIVTWHIGAIGETVDNTVNVSENDAPNNVFGELPMTTFTRGWRAEPTLTGYGRLSINDGATVLEIRLRTPLMNAQTGTLTFTTLVDAVLEPATITLADLPPSYRFEDATLYVLMEPQFMTTLQEGIDIAQESERECVCPPGTSGLICEMCEAGLP